MRKSFEYRLSPTKKQVLALESWLDECRWLYNKLLEQRRTLYETDKQSLTLYGQQAGYAELKKERETLSQVHSQVLQNVAVRLDLAFKGFFRRLKTGQPPGFPRFRGKFRDDSMTFPQAPSGCSIDGNHLKLSKIGKVKLKLHRPIDGTPKTCTIKRSSTGKWSAVFSCEVEKPEPLPASRSVVGIDVGLESFAHFSDDRKIENPRFFRQDEKELAKAQRKLSKEAKGTPERARRRKPVSRIHERIQWRRKNFAHQETRKIVNQSGFIAVEDLNVNRLLHQHCLAKSMSDAAWSLFFNLLFAKAEEAGRTIVKINPAYTSQDCSQCGHRAKKALSVRWHKCECCGFETHRDHNAALNILSLGLQAGGLQSEEAPLWLGSSHLISGLTVAVFLLVLVSRFFINVSVEISSRRAEQRKAEADGEAHYILTTGKAEAEKMRLIGEAQGVADREQVNALGANGVALIETLKVIGEKGVRITPEVMASGGNGDGAGGLGTLLLLNLFRDQMKQNGSEK